VALGALLGFGTKRFGSGCVVDDAVVDAVVVDEGNARIRCWILGSDAFTHYLSAL
jgi:hypothetical protein